MSDQHDASAPPQTDTADDLNRPLRIIALLCGLGSTVFWIYTFYFISRLPPGDHTGFQWLGAVPLTLVWLFLTLPALGLSLGKRLAAVAAGFGIASVIGNAMLWSQLLTEFAGFK